MPAQGSCGVLCSDTLTALQILCNISFHRSLLFSVYLLFVKYKEGVT